MRNIVKDFILIKYFYYKYKLKIKKKLIKAKIYKKLRMKRKKKINYKLYINKMRTSIQNQQNSDFLIVL